MESKKGRFGPLVGVIDVGRDSVRFLIFASPTGELLTLHSTPLLRHRQPPSAALELVDATLCSVDCAVDNLRHLDIDVDDIVAVAVVNNCPGVVVRWDRDTGLPLANAICDNAIAGTVDCWIIWKLTNGLHLTDVTNAASSLTHTLFNLDTLQWDVSLGRRHGLPAVCSSSGVLGYVQVTQLRGLPISACVAAPQAAVIADGNAPKCIVGQGCRLLLPTGTMRIPSRHLQQTVAYQLAQSPARFALQGSAGGAALPCLAPLLAEHGDGNSNGVVVVTAGEDAPFSIHRAQCSIICGLSSSTTVANVAVAVRESFCFHTRDLLQALADDGFPLTELLVDGEMASDDLLVQRMADLCGIDIVRPLTSESSALGAAMLAGSAKGIEVWDMDSVLQGPCDIFRPSISEDERDMCYGIWKKALARCYLDYKDNDDDNDDDEKKNVAAAFPAGVFVTTSLLLLVLAKALQ